MSTITWINTGSISQDQIKNTEIIINYMEGYINSHLARPINWDVSLNVDPSVSTANGNSNFVFLFKEGTKNLLLQNGAYQSITGVEKSGFDAIININPKYLTDYFLDPTPETKNDVPSNKTDTLSVFLHEMIHGLSFNGWTSWNSYENSTDAVTAFDKYITTLNGKPYFNGENAKLAYGGLVPLSPGNVFHLGNDSDGRQLESDVMQGFTFFKDGFRRTISDLNLAIFADCGIGTIRNDILAGSILADNIAAGAGNDTVRASVGDDIIDGGEGTDTAVFTGSRSQYSVSRSGTSLTVSDNVAGRDGLDTLRDFEFLRFADQTVSADLSPAYALAAASASVNEGSTATFTLRSTNVAAGTQVAYTLSGVSAADVQGGALTGTATIGSNGQATISVALLADSLTEGAETLTMTAAGKTASTTVNDTSMGSSSTYINALYVVMYNRTADSNGVNYWSASSIAGEPFTDALAVTMASSFKTAASAYFNAQYAALSDTNYILKLYQNLGGNTAGVGGDALNYWQGQLDKFSGDRAKLAGEFTKTFLDYNGADVAGLARKAVFDNKVSVSLAWVDASKTNPFMNALTTTDAAYAAQTRIIDGVTGTSATLDLALAQVTQVVSTSNLAAATGVTTVGGVFAISTSVPDFWL